MPNRLEILKVRALCVFPVALKDWVPPACKWWAHQLSSLYWRSLHKPAEGDLRLLRRAKRSLSCLELRELLRRDDLQPHLLEVFQQRREDAQLFLENKQLEEAECAYFAAIDSIEGTAPTSFRLLGPYHDLLQIAERRRQFHLQRNYEQRLLQLYGSIYGDRSPQLAWEWVQLGRNRAARGLLDEGLELVKEAGATLKRSVGPENYLYAHALTTYSELLSKSGRTDLAATYQKQASSTLSGWGF